MLPTVVTDLPRLARRIDECHFQVQYHAKGMLLEAKKAGEHLLEAKKLCPHGTFKNWVAANCRCKYRRAAQYMALAKSAVDCTSPDAWEEWQRISGNVGKAEVDAPAAPAPAPSFTREDAEYALKIHARVERGQDGERDVAATKLAKVAEGFGMDSEALVAKAYELCPDADATEHEKNTRNLERERDELKAQLAEYEAVITKANARLPEVTAKFAEATREELLQQIAILIVQLEEA